MEFKESMLQLKLDAVRDALKASRRAFTACTIISLAVVVAVWNAYLSWDRHFAISEYWSDTTSMSAGEVRLGDPQITQEAQKSAISAWVDSTIISVPVLGIRVAVSDLALLGSFGILIVSLWFYFTVRASNHSIGYLLRESVSESLETRKMILDGIAAHMVFNMISRTDYPIAALAVPTSIPKTGSSLEYSRWTVKFLLYFPVVAICFVIGMDILTIFVIPAALRYPHEALWSRFKNWDWGIVIAYETIALLFGIGTAIVCRRISAFDKATTEILREYEQLSSSAASGSP
jgi:hypothetical protein